jgi:hypothetical protein
MYKRLAVVLLVLIIALVAVVPAFAHSAPPCNDSDGDGSPSGREYAQHHIRSLATEGGLGEGGHKPGAHRGFSVCNPSGK